MLLQQVRISFRFIGNSLKKTFFPGNVEGAKSIKNYGKSFWGNNCCNRLVSEGTENAVNHKAPAFVPVWTLFFFPMCFEFQKFTSPKRDVWQRGSHHNHHRVRFHFALFYDTLQSFPACLQSVMLWSVKIVIKDFQNAASCCAQIVKRTPGGSAHGKESWSLRSELFTEQRGGGCNFTALCQVLQTPLRRATEATFLP